MMAVKILLARGDLKAAPYRHHYDAYRGKLVVTRLKRDEAAPVQQAETGRARKRTKNVDAPLARGR